MDHNDQVEGSAFPSTDEGRTIAEISQLAGGLAHELRNPLSTVMINLQLLAEDLRDTRSSPADACRRSLVRVEVLQREASRLQTLLDDFLHLTGPCRPRTELVDLNDAIARLVEFFRPQAESEGIEITVNTAPEPLNAIVDELLLRQALLNIVINAREAMPGGGSLRITTERRGDWAVISVSDSGVGIAPEDRDRLFRPFFSTKGTGTGLGLSITQRVVHEHGGSLGFETELGKGTTFTIRLPLDHAHGDSNVDEG